MSGAGGAPMHHFQVQFQHPVMPPPPSFRAVMPPSGPPQFNLTSAAAAAAAPTATASLGGLHGHSSAGVDVKPPRMRDNTAQTDRPPAAVMQYAAAATSNHQSAAPVVLPPKPANHPDNRCHLCGKTFSRKNRIKFHIAEVHEGRKDYKCQLCEKAFNRRTHLQEHVSKIHENMPKKYECKVCGKMFSRNNTMQIHIRNIHEGIKPHQCPHCRKGFTRRPYLAKHVIADHQVDPMRVNEYLAGIPQTFQVMNPGASSAAGSDKRCHLCGKCFKRNKYLKDHITYIHEQVKKYQCKMCDKWFNRSNTLTAHIRNIHEGIKPHKCGLCGKGFTRRQYLAEHVMAAHPVPKPEPAAQPVQHALY